MTRGIITAAMAVHSKLGPGFLESVYESAPVTELEARRHKVERQVAFEVIYLGRPMTGGMRVDVIVDRAVIVEVKSVPRILNVHKAQCLSYLRASNLGIGLVINFGVHHLRDGLARVYNFSAPTPII